MNTQLSDRIESEGSGVTWDYVICQIRLCMPQATIFIPALKENYICTRIYTRNISIFAFAFAFILILP